MRNTGKIIAGTKFIILNLVTSIIFKPKPTSRTDPTHIISVITSAGNQGSNRPAKRIILPCIKRTGMADKATPIPSDDANKTEVIPSRILLV